MGTAVNRTGPDNLRRVAIIGGGPAGVGCALTLLHEARAQARDLEALILEPKQFGRHFNQCAGVVIRDHLAQTLAQCGLPFPDSLTQRAIGGYVLHAGDREITLEPGAAQDGSVALRRVQFDEHLLQQAVAAGATLLPDRLTDLEFTSRGVTVYTEGQTYTADAIVGAFGLDAGAGRVFARCTGYQPPPCLDTLMTKLHPAGLEPIPGLLEDRIHAFLPRRSRIEFGALVPKGNHISVIAAGVGIRSEDLEGFLRLPEVAGLLPAGVEAGERFRGSFPLGLARRFAGERYLVVGDAAGLVRPFKGGGIHTALLTGRRAGLALLTHGPGPAAAEAYQEACRDLRGDVWYGRRLRNLVALLSGPLPMPAIVDLAHRDPAMQRVLYDCVSGRAPYRQILRDHTSPALLARAAWACATWPLRSHPPNA